MNVLIIKASELPDAAYIAALERKASSADIEDRQMARREIADLKMGGWTGRGTY
jgi:hypothetical protein